MAPVHCFAPWLLSACLLVLGACSAGQRGGAPRTDEAEYTLVYLETGPDSASHTPEQKQEIFKGHMANMKRLADEGKLIIAGPFGQPRNPAWRGIFVFDVPTSQEALALAQTDPGVQSAEFRPVARPLAASPSLRTSLTLEKAMQDDLKANPPDVKPGDLPPGLRRYVMMHAEDYDLASRSLRSAPGAPRIIWSARFRDARAGVFVLDATDPAGVERALAGVNVGPMGLDRWLSTRALERLP